MGVVVLLVVLVGFIYLFTQFNKSTSYGPKGFTGGYSETQLASDMYAVNFQGNGNTRQDKSVDFCMLRSAELTLQKGYKYFLIVDNRMGNQGYIASANYGPISSHPASNMTIKLLHEKPQNDTPVYDASIIAQSYKAKYNIKN